MAWQDWVIGECPSWQAMPFMVKFWIQMGCVIVFMAGMYLWDEWKRKDRDKKG